MLKGQEQTSSRRGDVPVLSPTARSVARWQILETVIGHVTWFSANSEYVSWCTLGLQIKMAVDCATRSLVHPNDKTNKVGHSFIYFYIDFVLLLFLQASGCKTPAMPRSDFISESSVASTGSAICSLLTGRIGWTGRSCWAISSGCPKSAGCTPPWLFAPISGRTWACECAGAAGTTRLHSRKPDRRG